MIIRNQTQITRDASGRRLTVVRRFNASLNEVWQAWTESSLLDKWWAPRPYRAETISLEFTEGGIWHYAMIGPDGSRQYCRADYRQIEPGKSFTVLTQFCDEEAKPANDMPPMTWICRFEEIDDKTEVEVDISFETEADLQKIVEMGFAEGFTAAHENLEELLAR